MFAVTTSTLVVASLFVTGRMWSRIGIVRRVAWDDYIMVLAWLIAFSLSLTINLATYRGLGRHDADISAEDMAGLRMCEYIFSVLYVCLCATPSFLYLIPEPLLTRPTEPSPYGNQDLGLDILPSAVEEHE